MSIRPLANRRLWLIGTVTVVIIALLSSSIFMYRKNHGSAVSVTGADLTTLTTAPPFVLKKCPDLTTVGPITLRNLFSGDTLPQTSRTILIGLPTSAASPAPGSDCTDRDPDLTYFYTKVGGTTETLISAAGFDTNSLPGRTTVSADWDIASLALGAYKITARNAAGTVLLPPVTVNIIDPSPTDLNLLCFSASCDAPPYDPITND
ncbi:MAG: hypothetical protein WCO52_03930 [bacterium]